MKIKITSFTKIIFITFIIGIFIFGNVYGKKGEMVDGGPSESRSGGGGGGGSEGRPKGGGKSSGGGDGGGEGGGNRVVERSENQGKAGTYRIKDLVDRSGNKIKELEREFMPRESEGRPSKHKSNEEKSGKKTDKQAKKEEKKGKKDDKGSAKKDDKEKKKDKEKEEKKEEKKENEPNSVCRSSYCYIAYWRFEGLTSCSLNGNWSGNSVNCIQEKNYSPVYYECYIVAVKDEDGKVIDYKPDCFPNAPKPNLPPIINTITLEKTSHSCDGKCANGEDSCEFNFRLTNIPREGLSGFDGLQVKNASLYDWARLSDSSISGNSLSIKADFLGPTINPNKTLSFDIQGISGFSKNSYTVYVNVPKPIYFKPLSIKGYNSPEVGKNQIYNMNISKTCDLKVSGNLNLKGDNIKIDEPFYYIEQKLGNDFIFNLSRYNYSETIKIPNSFSQILDSKNEIKDDILGKTRVSLDNNVSVNYNLFGKSIKYTLDGDTAIEGCEKNTLGVKLVGNSNYTGKGDKTGQEKIYTNMYSAEIRSKIYKNVGNLTSGRKNYGKVINGVYLNNKTVKISEFLDNLKKGDSVIIKGGNLIIDKNIDKEIGIVVLSKNDRINEDSGNIFITKDVEKISAYMFADGSIMSKDESGKKYDNLSLQKQLYIYGSIFTRNTIGGAVVGYGQSEYILPGGKKTKSFEEAEKYDLNYLRKSDLCTNEYSLKIEYNPKIQKEAPKVFINL